MNRGVGSEVETGLITNLNNKQKMYNFTKKVGGGRLRLPPPLVPGPSSDAFDEISLDRSVYMIHTCKM